MMDDAAAMRAAASALLTNHAQAPSTSSPAKAVAAKDKPIFTLKQMTLICEKMCQERTDNVRAEYDRILQQKLGEQYDAFVKFIGKNEKLVYYVTTYSKDCNTLFWRESPFR